MYFWGKPNTFELLKTIKVFIKKCTNTTVNRPVVCLDYSIRHNRYAFRKNS